MILVIDADASKVIEAVRSTGVVITRPMIEYAHYLISNMKNIGTWQLSNAVYGFVGGTADSHKWNWKDLRDVDAAYRLVPVTGGIGTTSHSANGIRGFLGTAGNFGAFNTFLIPSTVLTNGNQHASIYISIDNEDIDVSYGALSSSGAIFQGVFRRNIVRALALLTNTGSSNAKAYQSLSNQIGYHLSTINGSSLDYYYKGFLTTQTSTQLVGSSGVDRSIYIAGRNDPTITTGSSKSYGFFSIGSDLNSTIAIAQSQIVTNAQKILNRA